MKLIEPLFYGESISQNHHKRIKRQLVKGSRKMKQDFMVIVMPDNMKSIAQLLTIDEYAFWITIEREFSVLGVVADNDEFVKYIETNALRVYKEGLKITKENLQGQLLNSNGEQSNDNE